jgi:hypothetical protein
MFSHWPDFPAVKTEHLWDARLYADRSDLIRSLPVRRRGKIAEIGVWRAAFSKILVTELKPRNFFAFDIFTGHKETDWNGMTGKELFDGLTHRKYYEREMTQFRDVITIIDGPSTTTLKDYMDHSFDLVYVDAAHDYDSVKKDAELAQGMVADNGLLVFNDYTLLDPNNGAPYGIVPVVNELVAKQGWRIVGFALDVGMYCDIALRRCKKNGAARSRVTAAG